MDKCFNYKNDKVNAMKVVLNLILFFLLFGHRKAQKSPPYKYKAQNTSEYTLIVSSEEASCRSYEVTKNGDKYALSLEARTSLDCPNVIGIYKHWLFYANDKNQVKQYDLDTHTSKTMFTLYPDVDGVDGPFWSPDHSKIAFAITNQNMNHGYQSYVRVIIFDFAKNGSYFNKQKFDIAAYFDCGSRCGSTIDFLDNNTIRYRDIMDRGGDIDVVNYKYLILK